MSAQSQKSLFDTNSSEEETPTWKNVLAGEREKPYFKELLQFIESERSSGKAIYPPNADIFNALKYTPFEDVKVVIIGQDPYHGPGQAHGLCFSVRPGVPAPPSLKNIFLEIKKDLGFDIPQSGYLEKWAKQGILLLNTILTVEAGKPQSHHGHGWEQFTDRIISELNYQKEGLVFLLWGAHAQRKCENIDRSKHHVLATTHPSPFSAYRGFLGSKPFSQTNTLLREQGEEEVDWSL